MRGSMQIQTLVTKFWNNQLFRFLVVGGINTVFGYCMYALFIFIGLHFAIAVLLAQISGIIFNFNTTGIFVFNNTQPALIFRFTGVYTITYLVNVLFLKIFAQINYNMYLAGAILVLPIAFLSFFLNKTFVFPDHQR
jgi:putative flippase GtrA